MARSGERKLKKIECDEVLDQLSEYIDEETRAELCDAIREHLARCQDCQIKVDTVKKTIVLYQKNAAIELPVRVSAKLSAALAREYGNDPGRSD
jgi:predicted anti-sigma-YlaC factor YlaD